MFQRRLDESSNTSNLGKRSALVKQIYRERITSKMTGPSIKTYADLYKLPAEFKKYREEDFLLSEQQTKKNEAIHIYGSSSGLKILQDCSIWAADGTHKKCPNPFVQIYVVGGVLEGHFLPSIYCLLPDHSTDSYSYVFKFIQSIVKKKPVQVIINNSLEAFNGNFNQCQPGPQTIYTALEGFKREVEFTTIQEKKTEG